MTTNNLHGHSTFVNIDCFNAHLSWGQFDIQLFCRKCHIQLVSCRHNARWSKPLFLMRTTIEGNQILAGNFFMLICSYLIKQHSNKSHNAVFSQNISIPNLAHL